ncbi:transmembrane protein 147-like isoform X2 [Amphibalanus amphitrite]|uniref:transmembrane protein 147-like isoform X2 n=1 Tax=Amphibalanus amphitrite TaxID=1232801 RepID=UPI001C91E02F|nr:transmembrane protein 147-like isoform X2 [Amphibalanus amphitrite]
MKSEYGAFWKCVQAGFTYVFVQLCKMVLLATFFPAAESTPDQGVDLLAELLKTSVDIGDLLGIHLVMSRVAARGDVKVLVAGVGWSTAELILTRVLPLWVGARGIEFSWRYLQMSLDANISLVHYLSVSALVWLWSRHDLARSFLPLVVSLLVVSVLQPVLLHLAAAAGLAASLRLLARAAMDTVVAAVTLQLFSGLLRESY